MLENIITLLDFKRQKGDVTNNFHRIGTWLLAVTLIDIFKKFWGISENRFN